MEAKEFSAKTTEEAIALAVEHFGLPMDRLHVEVLEAGSSGLLGIFGAKKATVRVSPAGNSAEDDIAEVMSGLTGQRPAKAPEPPAPPVAQPAPPEPEPEPAPKPAPRAQATPEQRPAPAPEPPAEPAPAHERTGGRREPEPPEVVEAAREVLVRLVDSLDPAAVVEARAQGSGVELDVTSEEAGIMIGRRGQTLDALQYLTVRIVSHQQGRPVRISVDAGGYRRRRRQSLEETALRMAEKAKDSGRSVAVGPLTAPERRLVHLALKEDKGLTTQSRGRGELKKVIITPR